MSKLSHLIYEQLDLTAKVFSQFQQESGLLCPSGCGGCCFKSDISCAPYELLPIAQHLVENDRAEDILEKINLNENDLCVLLTVTDKENGSGFCSEYTFRPFICRIFGVAARKNKHGESEYSICPKLKVEDMTKFNTLNTLNSRPPFIEDWKKKLEAIDPLLSDQQIPINRGLKMMLERLLLLKSFGARG